MRTKICTALALSSALWGAMMLAGPAASGQDAAGNGTPEKFQPYTAEFKITNVKVLADGTTITREYKLVEARDAQGRRMTETSPISGSGEPNAGTVGTVNDPADGSSVIWQSSFRKAYARKLPPPDQRHGCWATDTGSWTANFDASERLREQAEVNPAHVPPAIEDLGSDTIDGVAVQGLRIVRTTVAGAIGNNNPLVTTSESWQAPNLGGLTLRSVRNDPQEGKSSRELVSLKQGEPDPALFQPPAGYEIVVQEMHQVPCAQLQAH
jgi:hypothetical protein